MSNILNPWELIAEATADRKVDATIAAVVEELDEQMTALHEIYELFRGGQYAEVRAALAAFAERYESAAA